MFRTASLIVIALFVCACTSIPARTPEHLVGYTQHGQASYYAMKYQFQTTASGEALNNLSNTAAHRTLPFGTIVKVTNRDTGQSVLVKINDRGPFIKERIIDLTRSAFSAIADTDQGVVPVSIEVVTP
ncbi:septal ring lytic transglycosylase RlpA family protein [Salinimonas sp. HHU 13199]|uniref:Endolytic peptidoglycan transglycosylase RlpA n=1 Tax=Salinimonas profundi TaxID=2729140 RepID=A0ABR8LK33_9ALTE|nr:septal ring lytic transglycosylase RlpA family protein [Salinimonas profundi]MBD3585690.1 septal ring lytic transglycosylase RlpA family protein [Salinimonas profundi]